MRNLTRNLSVAILIPLILGTAGCTGGALEYADAPPAESVPTLETPVSNATVAESQPTASPTTAGPGPTVGPDPAAATTSAPQTERLATGALVKSIFGYLPSDADSVAYLNMLAWRSTERELALDIDLLRDVLGKVPIGTAEIAVAARIDRGDASAPEQVSATRATAETSTVVEPETADDAWRPEYAAFVLRKPEGGYREAEIEALLTELTGGGESVRSLRAPYTKLIVDDVPAYDFMMDHDYVRLFHPAAGVLLLVRSEQQSVVTSYHRRPVLTAESTLLQHAPELARDGFVVVQLDAALFRNPQRREVIHTWAEKLPLIDRYLREGMTVGVGVHLTAVKGVTVRAWHGEAMALTLEAAIDSELLKGLPALFAKDTATQETMASPATLESTPPAE